MIRLLRSGSSLRTPRVQWFPVGATVPRVCGIACVLAESAVGESARERSRPVEAASIHRARRVSSGRAGLSAILPQRYYHWLYLALPASLRFGDRGLP